PLTDMHRYACIRPQLPSADEFLSKLVTIPNNAMSVSHRPGWIGQGFKLADRNPSRRIMAYHFWQIPTRTLHDSVIDECRNRRLTDIGSVGENEAIRRYLADSPN